MRLFCTSRAVRGVGQRRLRKPERLRAATELEHADAARSNPVERARRNTRRDTPRWMSRPDLRMSLNMTLSQPRCRPAPRPLHAVDRNIRSIVILRERSPQPIITLSCLPWCGADRPRPATETLSGVSGDRCARPARCAVWRAGNSRRAASYMSPPPTGDRVRRDLLRDNRNLVTAGRALPLSPSSSAFHCKPRCSSMRRDASIYSRWCLGGCCTRSHCVRRPAAAASAARRWTERRARPRPAGHLPG